MESLLATLAVVLFRAIGFVAHHALRHDVQLERNGVTNPQAFPFDGCLVIHF
jgi:hypothetical protein